MTYERHKKKGSSDFYYTSINKLFEMNIPLDIGNVVIFSRIETGDIHSVTIYKDKRLKEKTIIPLNDILIPHIINSFDCNDR